MSKTLADPRQLVVLARAFAAGDAGATPAQLRDAVHLLRPAATRADVVTDRDRATDALLADGALEAAGIRAQCTPLGRERLERVLPLRGSRLTWTRLRDGPLLVAALDLPRPDEAQLRRFATAGGLRAAVLTRMRALPLPPYPTAAEALSAAGWSALAEVLGDELGDWRKRPFGSGAVVSCVLGHRLGLRIALSASKLLSVLAANAAQARSDDVRALRAALLAGWLAPARATPQTRLPTRLAPTTAAPTPPEQTTTPRFAGSFTAAVREAADDAPVGRFGRGLVFIADLFEAFAARHPGAVADLDAFKQRLLELARSGDLSLVRADLVEAMDQDLVRRSEIRDLHATFHFVRV